MPQEIIKGGEKMRTQKGTDAIQQSKSAAFIREMRKDPAMTEDEYEVLIEKYWQDITEQEQDPDYPHC